MQSYPGEITNTGRCSMLIGHSISLGERSGAAIDVVIDEYNRQERYRIRCSFMGHDGKVRPLILSSYTPVDGCSPEPSCEMRDAQYWLYEHITGERDLNHLEMEMMTNRLRGAMFLVNKSIDQDIKEITDLDEHYYERIRVGKIRGFMGVVDDWIADHVGRMNEGFGE